MRNDRDREIERHKTIKLRVIAGNMDKDDKDNPVNALRNW
jgi:hypothetical protein